MYTILKLNVWVWQALKTAEIIIKRSAFSYTAVEFGILRSSPDRFFFLRKFYSGFGSTGVASSGHEGKGYSEATD